MGTDATEATVGRGVAKWAEADAQVEIGRSNRDRRAHKKWTRGRRKRRNYRTPGPWQGRGALGRGARGRPRPWLSSRRVSGAVFSLRAWKAPVSSRPSVTCTSWAIASRAARISGSLVAWASRQPFARQRPEHTVCRPRRTSFWHTGQREPTRDGGGAVRTPSGRSD